MQARSPLKQQTKVDASFARSVCCCRYRALLFSVFVIAGVVVAVAFVGIIATIATRIVFVGVFSVGRLCTYHPLQPSRNLPSSRGEMAQNLPSPMLLGTPLYPNTPKMNHSQHIKNLKKTTTITTAA